MIGNGPGLEPSGQVLSPGPTCAQVGGWVASCMGSPSALCTFCNAMRSSSRVRARGPGVAGVSKALAGLLKGGRGFVGQGVVGHGFVGELVRPNHGAKDLFGQDL